MFAFLMQLDADGGLEGLKGRRTLAQQLYLPQLHGGLGVADQVEQDFPGFVRIHHHFAS
jgi:hypothetical protein